MSDLFDATIVASLTNVYPKKHFLEVWDFLACKISAQKIQTIEEIAADTATLSPAFHKWLKEQGLESLPINNHIQRTARKMADALGIGDDNFGSGVTESELLLMAAAKHHKGRIITDDVPQLTIAGVKKKDYKIRAACRHFKIKTLTLLDLIDETGLKG